MAGSRLAADLRTAEVRLRALADARDGVSAYRARLVLAVVATPSADTMRRRSKRAARSQFAVLDGRVPGEHRVHRRAGDRASAAADIERGLTIAPDDPVLLTLRGGQKAEAGRLDEGLVDLDRAIVEGGDADARSGRAEALLRLGRLPDAVGEWTRGS